MFDLDYGETSVQESIEYTWVIEGDDCVCVINGDGIGATFTHMEIGNDVHFPCSCDFDYHKTE